MPPPVRPRRSRTTRTRSRRAPARLPTLPGRAPPWRRTRNPPPASESPRSPWVVLPLKYRPDSPNRPTASSHKAQPQQCTRCRMLEQPPRAQLLATPAQPPQAAKPPLPPPRNTPMRNIRPPRRKRQQAHTPSLGNQPRQQRQRPGSLLLFPGLPPTSPLSTARRTDASATRPASRPQRLSAILPR